MEQLKVGSVVTVYGLQYDRVLKYQLRVMKPVLAYYDPIFEKTCYEAKGEPVDEMSARLATLYGDTINASTLCGVSGGKDKPVYCMQMELKIRQEEEASTVDCLDDPKWVRKRKQFSRNGLTHEELLAIGYRECFNTFTLDVIASTSKKELRHYFDTIGVLHEYGIDPVVSCSEGVLSEPVYCETPDEILSQYNEEESQGRGSGSQLIFNCWGAFWGNREYLETCEEIDWGEEFKRTCLVWRDDGVVVKL